MHCRAMRNGYFAKNLRKFILTAKCLKNLHIQHLSCTSHSKCDILKPALLCAVDLPAFPKTTNLILTT